ncbi:BrxE family protein, partial [Desulfosporosinus burensis]
NNFTIDIELLFKLRLVVARFGEMDLAKWWNTKGQLGRLGSMTLRRGFPRTHHFAQARSVFAVASHRCNEVFNPPGCATLWNLPEDIEEEFNTSWERWLDRASDWQPFFEKVESIQGNELLKTLQNFELVTNSDVQNLSRLKRSGEGPSAQLSGLFSGQDEDIVQLAMGFALGQVGNLVVPYKRCP